jgi:hypothetical protein
MQSGVGGGVAKTKILDLKTKGENGKWRRRRKRRREKKF